MKKVDFVVGCDADGVLIDMYLFHEIYGKKFYKKDIINKDGYSPKELYGDSELKEKLYYLYILKSYCFDFPMRENTSNILNKMQKNEIKVHSITARKCTTSENFIGNLSRYAFEYWTEKNNVEFDSINYCSEEYVQRDKLLACQRLNVDVMIDDKPDVVEYLAANGIKVLMFDTPYNQKVEHENVIRVYNWLEVNDIINEMKEDKISINDELLQKSDEEYNDLIESITKEDVEKKIKSDKKFDLVYDMIIPTMNLKFKVKSYGLENVPYQTGFIFASNHLNSNDQYIISIALGKRNFSVLANKKIENSFRAKLGGICDNIIFVDLKSSDSKKESIKELGKSLVLGSDVYIFPEGTRKLVYDEIKDKKLLPFKSGCVNLAKMSKAPIIPVAIHYGEENVVNFGEPIFVKNTDNVNEVLANLEKKVEELLDFNLMNEEENKNIKKYKK